MSASYDSAFQRVIGHEAGFQANPKDRGNWTSGIIGQGELKGTKFGISAMSYPNEDIKNLTLARAKEIYKKDFWDLCRCDSLPAEVAFNVFDGAINSGVVRSIKWLQEAVGTNPDGIIGPKTVNAALAMPQNRLILRFNIARAHSLTKMNETKWNEFGRGLVNRVLANLRNIVG
jgi:lysozyme family protein